MKDIEIEIQVKIENKKPLLDFLNKNGTFESKKHQIDEYFSPKHEGFLEVRPVNKWLRLREADSVYFINYKNWHRDENGKSQHCDEYETKIENLDQMKKILNALNFKTVTIVDKTREIWNYKDYEIAIDSVKGLGDFIEIEYKGDNKNVEPKKITGEMIDFLKNIGVGKIVRNYVGYPFLLLFPQEINEEIF